MAVNSERGERLHIPSSDSCLLTSDSWVTLLDRWS
jgi:hypothetical protein